MKRHKMSRSGSRRMFSKTADRMHRRNLPASRTVMRGGIRL